MTTVGPAGASAASRAARQEAPVAWVRVMLTEHPRFTFALQSSLQYLLQGSIKETLSTLRPGRENGP